MHESYVSIQGKKIWYSVYGEDQKGVPLLVLHGGPGLLSMPQVVSDLSDRRPVYFYDQLGCGLCTDFSSYQAVRLSFGQTYTLYG